MIDLRHGLFLECPEDKVGFLGDFVDRFLEKRKYFQDALDYFDAKFLYLDRPTNTCHEKAELLGWGADRVVKALYFSNGKGIVCCIFPELDKELKTKDLFSRLLGISGKKAKGYQNSHYDLDDMERGTCSPFPRHETLLKGIYRIFIHDHPVIDDKLVDISVGGKGEEAHKVAMHIKYKDIYTILESKIGDRVQIVDFFGG